jgi:5-oxoprolinase (ATP-hydrolysing)
MGEWQFWIDRGGTFTDVIGLDPSGTPHTLKLLSDCPEHYADAAIEGIRRILAAIPGTNRRIAAVRMGTTVATNALLERRGEPIVLLTTRGLADVLRIGTQQRPDIFALDIRLPDMLYADVIEADERLDADGEVIVPLDEARLRDDLAAAARSGISSIAIVFMHAWRNPLHEQRAAAIAVEAGFTQISLSHDVSPTMRIVPRGDTTLIDAYLTPVLRRHIAGVQAGLRNLAANAQLEFMQSHGGLTSAAQFRGCNSVLSGPAGGVVGFATVAAAAGFDKVVGFDMGGTSTDVALYAGRYERTSECVVSGVRITTPMLNIHTIAAGGGSIIRFEDARLQVGPESAGASPGPAAYRNGGPLTLTDANVLLGRIQCDHFPAVFGPNADQPLDRQAVAQKFAALAAESGQTPVQLAEGAIDIAVERMAQAIARISTRRGIDLADFTLCAFGGAGAQHACRVAAALGLRRVLIHPMAGLLSALGIGLAEQRRLRRQTVERKLDDAAVTDLRTLAAQMTGDLLEQNKLEASRTATSDWQLHMKSAEADTTLPVEFTSDCSSADIQAAFREAHRLQFGYAPPREPVVESIEVEISLADAATMSGRLSAPPAHCAPIAHVRVYFSGHSIETPILERDGLAVAAPLPGPAVIVEQNSTTVLEPGWEAHRDAEGNLILTHVARQLRIDETDTIDKTQPDPVLLELFNNAFMHAAEQMGVVLQLAAHSVNIRERVDFSCAVFSGSGDLVANAPHVPVHLGSMGETVRALLEDCRDLMRPGNVLMSNNPLRGGTHLPDVTVVTPVFIGTTQSAAFIVASRAHHADVGGMTPGSMPPFSRTRDDEGAIFHGVAIVLDGEFREATVREAFANARVPARNPERNLADVRAQIAANARGVAELSKLAERYGLGLCHRYIEFMRANAAEAVRNALVNLHDGAATVALDSGEQISVRISIDHDRRSASIDFSGTSPMSPGNLNAPAAIARSAVLYTLRVLVAHDIPLNSGCLEPVELRLPKRSLVCPEGPVAVVGGNVETSQRIVDALFKAFGVLASSQGTMNNLTFGDQNLQYYETICGGAGASEQAHGADAVHTHMTNSRLTDPEVLEWRFPVRLWRFAIRAGSGGNGKHRGGNGVIRELEFLAPMTVAVLSNCRSVAPHGLAGGGDGSCGRNAIIRADAQREIIAGTAQSRVARGDRLLIETPGGGGYGRA